MYYSRKSPRMQHYDYSNENYYFITICTHNKKCLFGRPEENNFLRKLVEQHISKIETHYQCVQLDKYVVMPNHIHMILVLNQGQQVNIQQVIGQFKSGVTRTARKNTGEKQIWQRSFHDHVIRDQAGYEKIWLYIENNPIKWEEDCFYPKDSKNQNVREGQDPPLQMGRFSHVSIHRQ